MEWYYCHSLLSVKWWTSNPIIVYNLLTQEASSKKEAVQEITRRLPENCILVDSAEGPFSEQDIAVKEAYADYYRRPVEYWLGKEMEFLKKLIKGSL